MADDAGALLVRSGLVSSSALDEARAWVATNGGTLGEQLVVVGAIADDTLTDFYRSRLLVPQVNPNTLARLPQRVISSIPSDMAVELRAVPVALDAENNLTVAMSDPSDRHAVDEIAFFTGTYVVRAVATQMQIAWCLAHYYGHVTALGAKLLQPTGDPQPPPKPVVPPAIPRVKGHTAKIEGSRHRAIAPVTGPINPQRPRSGELDLVAKFGAAANPLGEANDVARAAATPPPSAPAPRAAATPDPAPPPAKPAPSPTRPGVGPVSAPVATPPTHLVPTASPTSPTLRPGLHTSGELGVQPASSNPQMARAPEPPAPPPPPAPAPPTTPATDESDGSPDRPRARSVSGEIRVPSRRAPSIRPPMPEPTEDDDDDSPVITIEANHSEDPTGPRKLPPRRRVKTDPPELAARAGEVDISTGPVRRVDLDEPRIIIDSEFDPSNRPPDVSGELRVVAHRESVVMPAATIEILADDDNSGAIIHERPREESEPVLLERRRPSDPPATPATNGAAASPQAIEPPRKTLVGRPKDEPTTMREPAAAAAAHRKLSGEIPTAKPEPERKTLDLSAPSPSPEAPRKTLVGREAPAGKLVSDPAIPLPAPLKSIKPAAVIEEDDDKPGEASDVVVLQARKPPRPTPDRRADKRTQIGIGIMPAASPRSHRDTETSGIPGMVDDQPTEASIGPPDQGFDQQPDVDPTRVDLLAAPGTGESTDETLAAPPSPDDTDPPAAPEVRTTKPMTAAWDAPTLSSSPPAIAPKPAAKTPSTPPATKPGTPAGIVPRATSQGEDPTNPRGKPAPARNPDLDSAQTLPRPAPRVAMPVRYVREDEDDDDRGPTTSVMSAVELDEAVPDRRDEVMPGHLARRPAQASSWADHDPVDDGWGPPGTTIPPPLLGAIPGGDDEEVFGGPTSRIPMPDVDSAPLIVAPPSPPEPARGTPALDAGGPALVRVLEDSTAKAIELIHALERTQTRDEVVKMMIAHLSESHRRAGFFSIKPDASKVNELSVFAMVPVPAVLPVSSLRLDKASTLQDVVGTRLPYRGPMHDDASRNFLMAVLGACPPEILLVPVAVRERVVGVLFGEHRMRHTFDDQLALAARAAGMALERILKAKRQ